MFTFALQQIYCKETNMCMTSWAAKALSGTSPRAAFPSSFKLRFIGSVLLESLPQIRHVLTLLKLGAEILVMCKIY